ncbi:MAG: mechanosensitive ion channel family protein [Thermanaerothrix sp.]|nr:mechanosensitive ion channel family protein [Thermanaerothrix sp.]
MKDRLAAIVDKLWGDVLGVIDDLFLWVLLYWALKRFIRHGIRIAKARAQSEGDQKRLDTLERVAMSTLRTVTVIVLFLSVLDAVGVNVKALLAGVGVAGLGISLAAQSMIKDFLCGVLILLENQFNVGDVVTIGQFSGVVETFKLRVTHLRNLDGELIVIPNSQITTVVNQTKGWSVAKVEVGIPYESDAAGAMAVMEECGRALMDEMGELVLEAPSVQGIVDFRDSSVILRALIKTPPGRHWEVGRRYRMLLKDAFQGRGMGFAYPRLDVEIKGPYLGKTPSP